MDRHLPVATETDDISASSTMPSDGHGLSSRTAIFVWLLASGTTVMSMVLALIGDDRAGAMLGIVPAMTIMMVGSLKAWLILRYYLGLGPSAGGWRGLFIAFLIVIFAGVLAAQATIILMNH